MQPPFFVFFVQTCTNIFTGLAVADWGKPLYFVAERVVNTSTILLLIIATYKTPKTNCASNKITLSATNKTNTTAADFVTANSSLKAISDHGGAVFVTFVRSIFCSLSLPHIRQHSPALMSLYISAGQRTTATSLSIRFSDAASGSSHRVLLRRLLVSVWKMQR